MGNSERRKERQRKWERDRDRRRVWKDFDFSNS